jgi:mannose-6-phosphate isomerase-like protein (cupin superfamily)
MAAKKTVTEEQKPEEVQAAAEKEAKEERVRVFVPYIEGEDPEVTVWVNDEITKFKKGYQVEVPKNVAEVLENSNQLQMVAMENRRKLKNQRQDW